MEAQTDSLGKKKWLQSSAKDATETNFKISLCCIREIERKKTFLSTSSLLALPQITSIPLQYVSVLSYAEISKLMS